MKLSIVFALLILTRIATAHQVTFPKCEAVYCTLIDAKSETRYWVHENTVFRKRLHGASEIIFSEKIVDPSASLLSPNGEYLVLVTENGLVRLDTQRRSQPLQISPETKFQSVGVKRPALEAGPFLISDCSNWLVFSPISSKILLAFHFLTNVTKIIQHEYTYSGNYNDFIGDNLVYHHNEAVKVSKIRAYSQQTFVLSDWNTFELPIVTFPNRPYAYFVATARDDTERKLRAFDIKDGLTYTLSGTLGTKLFLKTRPLVVYTEFKKGQWNAMARNNQTGAVKQLLADEKTVEAHFLEIHDGETWAYFRSSEFSFRYYLHNLVTGMTVVQDHK